METITFTKREYSELLEVKKDLERILEKKRIAPPRKDRFLRAFGILKGSFRGNSLDYVSKLRREWRK